MTINWKQEDDKLITFTVSGTLNKNEFQSVQKECEPVIQKSGKSNLLVLLRDFNGWEKTEGWEDMTFAERNDQYMNKMAIVGDPKWQDAIYLFTAPDFRSVPIRYFSSDEEEMARSWLLNE